MSRPNHGQSVTSLQNGAAAPLAAVTPVVAEALLQAGRGPVAPSTAVLSLLTEALVLITDEGDLLATAARVIGEQFGAQRVQFSETRGGRGEIATLGEWHAPGVPPLGQTVDLKQAGGAQLFETWAAQPMAVEDVERHGMTRGHALRLSALQLRSFATCPASSARPGSFVLLVGFAEPHVWPEAELALIEQISARVYALTDRVRSEAQLRKKEEHFRLAIDAARLGDWSWDARTDIVTFSPRAGEIFGLGDGPVMTWTEMRRLLHPEDAPRAAAAVEHAVATCSDYDVEYRVALAQGGWTWVAATGRATYAADGAVTGMLGVVQDITARKQAEEALFESEKRYRGLLEALPSAVYTCDLDGRIQLFNAAAAELWGRTPRVGVDRYHACDRLFQADGTPLAIEQTPIARSLRTQSPVEPSEILIERPDGTRRHVFPYPELLRDREGRLIGAINMIVDITEHRKIERNLRKTEARLHLATRSGKLGIWEWNIRSGEVNWTDSLYEIHGVRRGEFITSVESFMQLVHSDDRGSLQRALQSSLEHEVPFEMEFRAVRPGGVVIWLFTNAVVEREQGEPVRMIGATFDITARKQAELALRESEGRFRALASHAPVGIFLTDPNGDCLFVNEAWRHMAGLTAEQARGQGWSKALHPDDRDRVAREWAAAVRERRPFVSEYRFRRPDGTVSWLQGRAVEWRLGNGTVAGQIGTIVDLTQRREAELRVHESERELRALASHAPVGIFRTDASGATTFVNEAWCTMAGIAEREAHGHGWSQLIHPADRERVLSGWAEAVREGKASQAEYRFVRPDGNVTWVQGKAVPMHDSGGAPAGFIGTVEDVTARKTGEDQLRAREAQLRLISMNAPVMLVHCDRDERYLFVNHAYTARFGLEAEQVVGRTIRETLGESAHARLRPYIAQALRGEKVDFEIEVPYAGGPRTVHATYVPDLDAAGCARGFFCAITDVSERKRDEEAARRLAAIVESSSDAIVSKTLDGNITSWNAAAERLFGYTADEIIGQSILTIIPPDKLDEEPKIIACIKSGQQLSHFETVRRRKDGSLVQISLTVSPIKDGRGRIVGASKIARDITSEKRDRETLQLRTSRLETVNRVGRALAAELDLQKIVQAVTDAGRECTGAAFGAFFYNTTNERGESYTLYTLSGLPREAFSRLPMPRNTEVFGPTFEGKGVVRVGDITQDPRYGRNAPFRGMPAGHPPVRSYLALPVMSRSGEVIGGLFFGHPRPDVFTLEAEQTMVAIAAQAAIAIDNAHLYRALSHELEQKRRAEADLRVAQEQLVAHANALEQRVLERTASLREAVAQMEEFSYSVSHDLRSPLRAMNAYAQALAEDYGSQLDATAKMYLQRIQRGSDRMEKLTHDVLTYSRVARTEMKIVPVDLERLIHDVIAQYTELQPPAAQLEIRLPLHRVRAHESSLGQCLANLLTNAAKFVPAGVRPQVVVRTEGREGFVRLWVEDNGIGIPPEYHGRLFRVFERVPTRGQYEGTGIGLAIVRKAAEKMGGRCGVESDGQTGSRFWIDLPPTET